VHPHPHIHHTPHPPTHPHRCIWLGDSDLDDKDLAIAPLLDALHTSADRLATLAVSVALLLALPGEAEAALLVPAAFALGPPAAAVWAMRLLFSRQCALAMLLLDQLSHWMRKNAEVGAALLLLSVLVMLLRQPTHT
jgi:hypothetical protein